MEENRIKTATAKITAQTFIEGFHDMASFNKIKYNRLGKTGDYIHSELYFICYIYYIRSELKLIFFFNVKTKTKWTTKFL